jgi:hypothetical protein
MNYYIISKEKKFNKESIVNSSILYTYWRTQRRKTIIEEREVVFPATLAGKGGEGFF